MCHKVDAHAVAPILRQPLQLNSEALVPYKHSLVSAVEGCNENETLETVEHNLRHNNNWIGNCKRTSAALL
jgi:hypothetical protein